MNKSISISRLSYIIVSFLLTFGLLSLSASAAPSASNQVHSAKKAKDIKTYDECVAYLGEHGSANVKKLRKAVQKAADKRNERLTVLKVKIGERSEKQLTAEHRQTLDTTLEAAYKKVDDIRTASTTAETLSVLYKQVCDLYFNEQITKLPASKVIYVIALDKIANISDRYAAVLGNDAYWKKLDISLKDPVKDRINEARKLSKASAISAKKSADKLLAATTYNPELKPDYETMISNLKKAYRNYTESTAIIAASKKISPELSQELVSVALFKENGDMIKPDQTGRQATSSKVSIKVPTQNIPKVIELKRSIDKNNGNKWH